MLKIENLIVAFWGVISLLIFIVFILIGTLLDAKSYFLSREFSYFISPYLAGNAITIPLFQLYNIALIFFSLGLFIRFNQLFARLGSMQLFFSAIVGLILIMFPMENPLLPQTLAGLIHVIIVTIMMLFIVNALLYFSKAFLHYSHLIWLSSISYGIALVLLVFGGLSGIFAYYNRSLVGLAEKLPVGAFLFWIFLVSVSIIKSDKRVKYFK